MERIRRSLPALIAAAAALAGAACGSSSPTNNGPNAGGGGSRPSTSSVLGGAGGGGGGRTTSVGIDGGQGEAGPSCATVGPSTSLLPSDRIAPWSPGVAGGIPSYPKDKTACNSGCTFTTHGDDTQDDSATIQKCVTQSAAGHACELGAGTYAIASKIVVPSNVVLRGAGKGKTILHNRNGGGIAVQLGGGNSFGTSVGITSGFTKGSQSLVLATAAGLSVGQMIGVTQSNDTTIVNVTGVDGTCTWCGGPWHNGAQTQVMGQLVQIAGISGTTITLDRPLYFTFQQALSPVVLPATSITTRAGVEGLTVEELGTGAAENQGLVDISECVGCWAKGVELIGAYSEFFELKWSKGCEVRDSYAHDPATAASGRGYGAHVLYWNSDHLVENNVFVKCRHSVAFEGGGSGCVIGYNYAYRDWESDSDPQWLGDDIIFHGAHAYMNLIEGNEHQELVPDTIWGSSSHNTYFRNHATGAGDYSAVATEGTHAIDIEANNPYFNVVGNVLGLAGTTTPNGPSTSCAAPGLWRLGCSESGGSESPPAGASVIATLSHCGNYSYATTQGAGSAAGFASASLPGLDAACSLPLPQSYYLACKPAWFGTCQFPPIGPDVSGKAVDIPAKRMLEHGSYTAGCP